MQRPWFQLVPNLSEGRRGELVEELAGRLRAVSGLHLADYSWDADHNRCVFTMLAGSQAARQAVMTLYEWAAERLDVSRHTGQHPRLGAVDVLPVIPLGDTPMQAAVELAVELAEQVAERFHLPVYLYEEASRRPALRSLPDIRKGQLEGLRERIGCPGQGPDFGPARLHPSLGATVVGARGPLVAYNVVLDTSDLSVAQKVARKVRERDGGLVSVRALGVRLEAEDRVQVSMNLTRPLVTSLYAAFEKVRTEARRYGVGVHSTQIIGVPPLEVLAEAARYYLRLDGFGTDRVLEQQMMQAVLAGGDGGM